MSTKLDAEKLAAENRHLRELIAWVAPRIVRRNENFQKSDKFCVLCVMGPPELRRQPCRHHEIWQIAEEQK